MFSNFGKDLRSALSLSLIDFKVKNEGAYLGILWYLLDPLFYFVAIMIIRSALQVQSVENFAVYLVVGLVMFNFFRSATSGAARVIQSRSQFIKSMPVSPSVFVLSNCLQSVYSHFFEVVILFFILLYFGLPLTGIVLYLVVFIALFILSLGISFFVAPLGAFSNDFYNVWQLLLRVLFFLTPIFYVIPKNSSFVNIINLNPLTHFLSLGRDCFFKGSLQFWEILCLFLVSFIVLALGFVFFKYLEKYFAEWV